MTIARAFVVLNLTQASVYTHTHWHTHTGNSWLYVNGERIGWLHCLLGVSTANETRLMTDEPDTDSDSDYLPYNG